MLHRFLCLGKNPELRSDPLEQDASGGSSDIEVALPVDIYLESQEILKKIRYANVSDSSTDALWRELAKKVHKYIVFEKDRSWFYRTYGNGK